MPELPEVETVRRGLVLALEGKRLSRVEVRRPDLRRPFPDRFAERLRGRRIRTLRRRAKYLLLGLDSGEDWLIHLGMSGRMLVGQGWPNDLDTHDHVVFGAEDGTVVRFNDARRFGVMDLMAASETEAHPLLAGIGPEPLDPAFDGPALAKRLAGKAAPIKAALLDQRVVAGIGNIYASEALFRARISPTRKSGTVQGERADKLATSIKRVLSDAIEAGGSSLRDHRQTSGELGYFQHSFAVYGREGERCPACRSKTGIRALVQSGRSTFYCAKCQR
ncbi:MAG: bifunctional DNA-formamidopyrimidine glycosylase/DNA-(apurinic or apyrimidinic site) lyase [Alphaproteobacteria bacterium]|nr:bifunctional DNA-formamidopyrimidine glycosylase/DNA-(apurinic or apyrimidinic site) lyase [Alphaproteobacteria bacterium]